MRLATAVIQPRHDIEWRGKQSEHGLTIQTDSSHGVASGKTSLPNLRSQLACDLAESAANGIKNPWSRMCLQLALATYYRCAPSQVPTSAGNPGQRPQLDHTQLTNDNVVGAVAVLLAERNDATASAHGLMPLCEWPPSMQCVDVKLMAPSWNGVDNNNNSNLSINNSNKIIDDS